jgi:hypothetical protein
VNPPEKAEDGLRFPLTKDLKRGDLVLVDDLWANGTWRLYTQAEAAMATIYGTITEVLGVTHVGENLYDIETNLGTARGAFGDWTAVAK